jgi:hypothetical protein
MGQHFLAAADKRGPKFRDCMQAYEVRQLFVVDVMVDVENVAGPRRHALVQRTLEIDDDLDAALVNRRPVGDHRRNEEALFIVNWEELCQEQVGHRSAKPAKYTTISGGRRPRRRWATLPVITAIVLSSWVGVAGAQTPDWTDVPLPGGRTTLLPALGLSSELPRALVLAEIVRVAHQSRDPRSRPLKIVLDYFAKPPTTGDEVVPIPLAAPVWRSQILVNAPAGDRNLLGAILANRRASLLAYGLMGVDAETLTAIRGDVILLRRLYEQHATTFAAFSANLRVRNGVLVLPGGPDMQPLWQVLVQSPFANLRDAIPELLGRDDGRLASFVEAIEGLDAAHVRLVLDDAGRDKKEEASTRKSTEEIAKEKTEKHAAAFKALYQTFVDVEPAWKTSEFPFLRLSADPALLLAMAPIGPDGHVFGTVAYWRAVVGSDDLPDSLAARDDLRDSDAITLPELLRLVTPLSLPARQAALGSVAFTARLATRFPDSTLADRVYMTRAWRRFHALILTLERADIRDWQTWMALVRRASYFDQITDDTSLDTTMALFQTPIVLIERALRARALDRLHSESLLKAFAAVPTDRDRYGREVANWIATVFMPALGYQASQEGLQAEGVLLEALAGMGTRPAGAPVVVQWEGTAYRVDRAAAELARLTNVRTSQEGNTLDAALTLSGIGGDLESARDVAEVRSIEKRLRELSSTLVTIEPNELAIGDPMPDVDRVVHQALLDVERVRSRSGLKRAVAVGERMRRLESAVLADVLTSIVYALSLGDPDGRTFLAGNVARRHEFGRHLIAPSERERTRWMMPFEAAGEGKPWHVRGALLGLDIGLARMMLRRTRGDLPALGPTISQADRRVLTETLVLTTAADLNEERARQVLDWLDDGRARLKAWTSDVRAELVTRLAIGERRAQAAAWTGAHDASTLTQLFTLTELVLLGRRGDDPVPSEWGVSRAPLDGSLALAFPDPPAPQRYSGRSGAGLMATRVADVNIRVLEALEERHLPVALAPGVLAAMLQDVLDDARLAYFDDWLSLSREVQALGDDQIGDYVSALTADGPLVPTQTGSRTVGHP